MTDFFATIIGATPPITVALLALVAFVAGFSRGLTGFGAGMIFVPMASGLVGPLPAIGLIYVIDTPTIFATARGALLRADKAKTGMLLAGWALTTPFGLWLLRWLDPLTVRWIICLMIICAVVLLVMGWTYRGKPTLALAFITGLIAGITGGLTGLSGPPIVMLWLAAASATAMNVRDNINLFFLVTMFVYAVLFPAYGILTWAVLRLGLLLAVPYAAGFAAGTLVFNRMGERNYRRAAYIVIGTAALLALPWMDKVLGR